MSAVPPSFRRRSGVAVLSATMLGGPTTGVLVTPAAVGQERAALTTLHATLRPGGDPDGSGNAHFRLFPARGKVCAAVEWSNIGDPVAAHIHRRSDGAVKVDLTGAVTGGARCETGVAKRLVRRIAEHPRRYYFNVHTAAYPAGAIEGVLHR